MQTQVQKKRVIAWYWPASAGFLCMAGVAVYLMKHDTPESRLIEGAAKEEGISAARYQEITDRSVRVERTHNLTKEDWNEARSDFHSNNLSLQISSLQFLANGQPKGTQREEAIGMTKQFLGKPSSEGKVAASAALHNLGDSSWKEYAKKLESDPDPNVVDAVRNLERVIQEGEGQKK